MQVSPTGKERKTRILEDIFGFQTFRPGQEGIIDSIFQGENVLAVMPTGSGKSLCFQIPAIGMEGLTVVVSPLVALMQDQVAALNLAGVNAETINSSHDRPDNVATWRRVAAGETRILYLSPERLMTEPMLQALARLPLSLFVIDEAHCISQWGPSFRPEYEALSRLREQFPQVPLAAFTATADEVTRQDISAQLFGGPCKTVVLGFDRPNIRLSVQPKQNWRSQTLAFVAEHAGQSGIVYCLSRKKTEETASFLAREGFPALPYHAGMEKAARAANQEAFMSRDGVVMVATIAFGMGIDKPDVRFVLHTDIPATVEAYYQEFGRAGRDGEPAEAMMLYGLADIAMRRRFIEEESSGEEQKRRQHKRLDALLAYCDAPQCRRIPLLSYFGEAVPPCGNCDVCLNPVATVDGSEVGKMVLAAVEETGQRFGAAHIVDVLRGANSEKIRNSGHEKAPSYGAGAATGKSEWRSITRQLVAAGFLKIDIQGYGGLSLMPKGRGLLEGAEEFRYRKEPPRERTRGRTRETGKTSEAPRLELHGEDFSLLAELKKLRLKIAKERGVPAFVVFHDRTLQEMAGLKPRTEREFGAIAGVGAAKLKDFAGRFLEAISAHAG